MRLGILPAAGKAERWRGYPKELLPVSDDDTFMSTAVTSLQRAGCNTVVIVTNPQKIHLHSYHLRDRFGLAFVMQQGEELWGAIMTAMTYPADEYFFMMPDTFLPRDPFPKTRQADFSIGVFVTEEPERFGMLRGGTIRDKEPSGSPGLAWGALAWSRSVAEHWSGRSYMSHTEAFNDAMAVFGFDTWTLDFYFDVGSMANYAEFLSSEVASEELAGNWPANRDRVDVRSVAN